MLPSVTLTKAKVYCITFTYVRAPTPNTNTYYTYTMRTFTHSDELLLLFFSALNRSSFIVFIRYRFRSILKVTEVCAESIIYNIIAFLSIALKFHLRRCFGHLFNPQTDRQRDEDGDKRKKNRTRKKGKVRQCE